MAMLLSCRGIKKDFGDTNILDGVDLDIAEGERIGLVGLNGAGKTTLANIIAGSLEIDHGSLLWHKKSVNIGYLRQESAYTGEVYSEGDLQKYLYTARTFGLEKVHEWDGQRLSNLSGGEKTKLFLSQIWSQDPDFLILDEPTNHLDYEGVSWLLREIRKFDGTILVISHDRYFLDQCVTKIVEVENRTLQEYHGNYSFYREEKKRRYEQQLNQYLLQEEKKKEIQEQIMNLKAWSAKAHKDAPTKAAASGNKKGGKEFLRAKAKKMDIQIKSRIKRLEKIQVEGVARPEEERTVDFQLQSAMLKGNRVIEAYDIAKAFDGKVLIEISSFYVLKGDKVGIFGENGCGKTTLLKLLLGSEQQDKGDVYISPSARLGYLSQDISHLDLGKRVLDCFEIASREERAKLQSLLFNMGFPEGMLTHTLDTLSLGELTRLRIAILIMQQCDLLILDEPLNHLDIHSREKLEEVLLGYNGTILLVSHDRYMMERICDKLLVFENKRIMRLEYGLEEYLDGRTGTEENGDKAQKEALLLVENEISYVLGELSRAAVGSREYLALDSRFRELISKKIELNKN